MPLEGRSAIGRSARGLLCAAVILVVSAPVAQGEPPARAVPLFESVNRACECQILRCRWMPAGSSRVVRLNADLARDLAFGDREARPYVLFNLFEDASFPVLLRRAPRGGKDGRTWVEAKGLPHRVPRIVLIANPGTGLAGPSIAATVWTPSRGTYEILPLGDRYPGLHVIHRPDPDRLPPCGADRIRTRLVDEDGKVVPAPMGKPGGAQKPGGGTGPGASRPRDRHTAGCAEPAKERVTIDLLVVYTGYAADGVSTSQPGAGGDDAMKSAIVLAIEDFQRSLDDGGIDVEVRLATDPRRVEYDEAGTDEEILCRLLSPMDNVLDDLHDWRDDARADVVVLVLETLGAQGWAPRLKTCGSERAKLDGCKYASGKGVASSELAFALVKRSSMNANFTLTHEVGHVLGCCHEVEIGCEDPLFAFCHGHRLTQGGVAGSTLVATNGGGGRVPFFSDPNATCTVDGENYVLGVTDVSDNTEVIRRTAPIVAAFR